MIFDFLKAKSLGKETYRFFNNPCCVHLLFRKEAIQSVDIKNVLQYINRIYLLHFPVKSLNEKQQYTDSCCCRLYDQKTYYAASWTLNWTLNWSHWSLQRSKTYFLLGWVHLKGAEMLIYVVECRCDMWFCTFCTKLMLRFCAKF